MTHSKDHKRVSNCSTGFKDNLILLVAAMAGIQSAIAQTTATTPTDSNVQALNAITIVGRQQQEQTPWTTQTDRSVLDELQVRNFAELGSRVLPGVNFSSVTDSINIRGLDKNRVVTRVDGVRPSTTCRAAATRR